MCCVRVHVGASCVCCVFQPAFSVYEVLSSVGILLRADTFSWLEARLKCAVGERVAFCVQQLFRSFRCRRQFLRLKSAVISLQVGLDPATSAELCGDSLFAKDG